MRSGTDWLKTALDAMGQLGEQGQPAQGDPAQVAGQSQATQQATPQVAPEATPTTVQRIENTRKQRAEIGQMAEVSIPDAARRALPSLNQSLYFLTNELMSRDDMRLPENAARTLAVEIMTEWITASRKGTISDLASIIAKSDRIQSVISSIP